MSRLRTAPAPPVAPLDLSHPLRLHVVGVGGPGMSAIAIALAEMGHEVSGSDLREQPALDRVRAAGVTVHVGHDRSIVQGCDAVTASTAIPSTNIELDEARRLGIPTLRRAGMLASLCGQARAIAVAGTHGKTTTTSMLMLAMAEAGHGVAIIPSALRVHRYTLRRLRVMFRGKPMDEPLAMMWDKRRPLPAYAKVFCEMAAEHVKQAFPVKRQSRRA